MNIGRTNRFIQGVAYLFRQYMANIHRRPTTCRQRGDSTVKIVSSHNNSKDFCSVSVQNS